MAFRRISHDNRRIQMTSLIDLIFILLIFFVISSILIKLTTGESKLYVPTPKNEPGEAQILIQILDGGHYLWLDHTAIDTLRFYSQHRQLPSANNYNVDLLLSKMTLNSEQVDQRLDDLKNASAGRLNKDYFVLIRCPEEQPYYLATNIIEKMLDAPNLEYGCVAGTIDDIRASKVLVQGNIMQIDF